jgi:hypothetical protein
MDSSALDVGANEGGMVNMDPAISNARTLERELAWLCQVIDARFKHYFEAPETSMLELAPPLLEGMAGPYAEIVKRLMLDPDARLALILALVPHIRPQLLDVFHTRNRTFDRRFTEFGGVRPGADGDFWPTGETFQFLAAGNDLAQRFRAHRLFAPDHAFAREGLLSLRPAGPNEPAMKGALHLSEEHLSLITTGQPWRPAAGAQFPAESLEARLDWSDLVLHPTTAQQLAEITNWVAHGGRLMNDWGMAAKLRPGYRSLFYGPPGTGKTMTAGLIGKQTGRAVYRIDLSLVVSKYIGETEKNLASVFDRAQHRAWILFFDEADALFGKRSETRDSHDRYANQEVAYLLQRIETFDGIAILASNLRDNIDAAFARRFESVIYFPMPGPDQRSLLWRQGFSQQAKLAPELDLGVIAKEYELSGAAIMNAVRSASLASLAADGQAISHEDVVAAIRREYAKEGRAV